LLILGRTQAAQNKKDEARQSFAKLIADYPESQSLGEAHYRSGEVAYGAGDFKAAAAEYEAVVAKWVDGLFGPYALNGKGWSHFKLKDYPPAVESFTSLLTKFPDHQLKADGLLGRAMSRRQAGDAKAAIADLDDYLKTNPDQAHKSDALYEKGLAQVALNDFAGAITTLDDLLKADAKYAAADSVLYEIGWAYKSQEKHAEAVPVFARLAAEHPDSSLAAEAWFHVGEDKYEKKDYAAAAKAYASAKKKGTGDLVERTDYKLGWAHYQLKEYDQALAQFNDQLANFGSGSLAADATFMKAECLFRLENYKEAWPAYQAALKTKASTPAIEVLTLLHGGQAAGQLKLWDEALKLLTTIPTKFAESPLVAEAHYEIGYAQENSNQPDEALQSYEQAATLSRDQVGARARFMMGELYFGQKKYDEATREFQRAMFGFGGEAATPETKNWQAKSGYEAGRCAEVQIATAKDAAAKAKQIADAKRFYTFVTEKHAAHELAAEAAKRLAALGKL
ncbi:MAG: tetratricopeptide repeat protein, partial [Pirellulaceae bacterium]|nr:tetratricopeptide repeat protein [Pirellulaceae bacterium]